ncbi:unnamed protein product, partial [Discosporangium mesarthrocarpum]
MSGPSEDAVFDHGNDYQLDLLLKVPNDGGEPFTFICSGSGGYGRPDRICALRGRRVHIITLHHTSNDSGDDNDPADASALATRPVLAHIDLENVAEHAAWNDSASCVVVGDSGGRLHFLSEEATLLFSQHLVRPLVAGRVTGGDDA